jgi:hypothetical protein
MLRWIATAVVRGFKDSRQEMVEWVVRVERVERV